MKRILLAFLLVTLTSCAGIISNTEILSAQTFPTTVHAEIDFSSDVTITQYKITWDAQSPITYNNTSVPGASCAFGTPCVKSPTFTVNDSNVHSFSIVAHNTWGDGPALTGTFQVKIPNKPTSTGNTIQPGA